MSQLGLSSPLDPLPRRSGTFIYPWVDQEQDVPAFLRGLFWIFAIVGAIVYLSAARRGHPVAALADGLFVLVAGAGVRNRSRAAAFTVTGVALVCGATGISGFYAGLHLAGPSPMTGLFRSALAFFWFGLWLVLSVPAVWHATGLTEKSNDPNSPPPREARPATWRDVGVGAAFIGGLALLSSAYMFMIGMFNTAALPDIFIGSGLWVCLFTIAVAATVAVSKYLAGRRNGSAHPPTPRDAEAFCRRLWRIAWLPFYAFAVWELTGPTLVPVRNFC